MDISEQIKNSNKEMESAKTVDTEKCNKWNEKHMSVLTAD